MRELLGNARKFHPQQAPTIQIELIGTNAAVGITIYDDGQPLTPEQLAKAWLPYYQRERYFTGQQPGMGLGLPMVAALIWRVGGVCRIYNHALGPGVTFELMIPLVVPDYESDETLHHESARDGCNRDSDHRRHIALA